MPRKHERDSDLIMQGEETPLNFEDALVEGILQKIRSPEHIKEVLYSLIIDLALKAKNLKSRKAFELIGALIALVYRDGSFPDTEVLTRLKSEINFNHRNREFRTSEVFETLYDLELGEREVKKFLHERAWKGMPGFNEDGTPMK